MRFPSIARCAPLLIASILVASAATGAAAQSPAPVLRGRVVAANGASVAGVRVAVRSGLLADTATVDSSGAFAIPVPAGRGAVEVRAAVDSASAAAFYPALGMVRREDVGEEQGFVLVPRVWAITAGRYAGQPVEIDLARAFRPACGDCSGFFRFRGGRLTSTRGRTLTWPAQQLPVRVAFDRDREGGPQLGARDSAAFWTAAAALEAALGERLFRASSYPDALPRDETPGDVVLVRADPTLHDAGLTTVVSGEDGISYAAVRFQTAALFTERGGDVVSHEMLHSVGIGHTCSWRSVMAPAGCPGQRTDVATPQDVAHVQLLLRMGELQRDPGLRWGMEEALDAAGIPRPATPPTLRQASMRHAIEGPFPGPTRLRIIIPHGT
ncbi:MAG TPA: carboxypeptidase-like regulatory domain-containing protein [Longimicrobiaceae bacterium]|nr:carboxypeptidase-like regulatory domain-containing protein [Longimicrobiaceae bacterium]